MKNHEMEEEVTKILYLSYSLLIASAHWEEEYQLFPHLSGTASVIVDMLENLKDGLSPDQLKSAITN